MPRWEHRDYDFTVPKYFTLGGPGGKLPTLTIPEMADAWIYFIQPVGGGPIKIGLAKDVGNRLGYIRGSHWQEIALLGKFRGNGRLEAALHHVFRERALMHEWFEDHPELREAIAFYTSLPEQLAA